MEIKSKGIWKVDTEVIFHNPITQGSNLSCGSTYVFSQMPVNFLPEQKQEPSSKNVWNNMEISKSIRYILGLLIVQMARMHEA